MYVEVAEIPKFGRFVSQRKIGVVSADFLTKSAPSTASTMLLTVACSL